MEIVAREECLSKQRTEPAIAKAVEAYEKNSLDADAAKAAVESTAELHFISRGATAGICALVRLASLFTRSES